MCVEIHLMGELSTIAGTSKLTLEVERGMSFKQLLKLGIEKGLLKPSIIDEINEEKYLIVCDKRQINDAEIVNPGEKIYVIPPIYGG